ncbi:MAG: hypothetical protein OJF51_000316 [Nitrospira sp.]|nr:MAG: hypothetical protein OJF51_000316 [Nitrospira sp.]
MDRSTLTAGIYFVSHGARLAIRANDPAVLDRLYQHLPPGWQPISSPIVDTVYSIIVSSDGLTFYDRRFQLYVDSTPLARTTNLDDLCETIEADLHFRVALHARQLIFVHAGVVGWQGSALVIPGRSGTGKTYLVATLVQAGATYYSDEYAVFDAIGQVCPYPRRLVVRTQDHERPTKLTVDKLGGHVGTEPLPVRLIMVTTYRFDAQWRPNMLSPGQAALALLDNTVVARIRPSLALVTLRHVVLGAVALNGPRGEAADVVQPMLNLLEKEPFSNPRA